MPRRTERAPAGDALQRAARDEARSMFDIRWSELGPAAWAVNGLVAAASLALFFLLTRPRVRSSDVWRATVTPLASIIGSGFLVVAPLLGFTAGRYAVLAMAGIIALAWLVGSAVRYDIAHVEDLLDKERPEGGLELTLQWMARVGRLVLAAAYVVAVTFYLELLGAFVLRMFGAQDPVLQKSVATALLLFIGGFGLWRGLRTLETIEGFAVETKLAVIGGLLLGLAFYNGEELIEGSWTLPDLRASLDLHTVRQLLGAFLVVQGFETSRYLRGVYPAELRVRTMRHAQWISAAIYVAFVGLSTVLLDVFDSVSETGIIDLSARVAFVLPFLLVVGAAMSQFSAAVADTIGSGGLVEELSGGRISRRATYAGVAGAAVLLLWTSHILEVIAYASRAFALYYAVQCALATLHVLARGRGAGRVARGLLFGLLTALMLLTALFGIPADTAG